MKLKHLFTLAVITLMIAVSAQAKAPKYVFFFIGDGMGMAHVQATNTYNRVMGYPELLMTQLPVAGIAATFSANMIITDSAAAGTALATGKKTNNGMLGVAPDSAAVISIARQFKDKGYGIGIITSVAPDDATPGAFYAHQPSRKMRYEIGMEAAKSGYEFIAGSGFCGFRDKNGNATPLMASMLQNGYTMLYNKADYNAAKGKKKLILQVDTLHTGNMGYTIDADEVEIPLADISTMGLEHLKRVSPKAFFMMIEGGNIDHAAHGNDGAAVIKEIAAFDKAIKVAYDFYKQHPDETLIVITADHNTGGMNIGFGESQQSLKYVDSQKISKELFSSLMKAQLRARSIFTWDNMKDILREKFGLWGQVNVTLTEEAELMRLFDITFNQRASKDQKTLYSDFNAFAVALYKIMNDKMGISWTTVSHAGNPVPVFAVGVGAERFGKMLDNTEIPATIRAISGLSNPNK